MLILFAVTEFLLSLTPGPAVLTVISQGMRYGFIPSVRGTLGILSGNAIYFALSAVGLGAILLASANLFLIIKWLGVAYLIFIGLKMLLAKGEEANEPTARTNHSIKLFSQGLVTQLSNPKAIVFFTALLPQFVSPHGNVSEQFVVLGIISIGVELPVLLTYGWLAEKGRGIVTRGMRFTLANRIAGACLIGAGIGVASLSNL